MSIFHDKDCFTFQIYDWMPVFYDKNELPKDMPDDLKTHILKTNPKEVSEEVSI
jgi:hypothetical protein